jgi:UDP-2,3-diacylglucosamine hydrolase
MKFITISDVHIKEEGDSSEELLLRFFKKAKELEVGTIYLLGDVFDLLVGGHLLYESAYPRVFSTMREALERGVEIVQLEGNHDFHFEALVKKLLLKWNVEESRWKYETAPLVREYNQDKILFAHGDEIELGNESYKRYRRFIRSGLINFLANKVVSPKFTRAIGKRASRKSRKRNTDRYNEKYEEEKVRPLFRKTAMQASDDYGVNIVICGHSHCFDIFEEKGLKYYNNGYLPRTKKCFFYDGVSVESIDLDSSE